jgi:hypothetical protein
MVTIPSDTELVFGPTCNNIVGNTSSLVISSCNDTVFNVGTSNSIKIPQTTKLQFGTSGNNYINYLGETVASLSLFGENTVRVNGPTMQINTTNTRFYDPILTLGDYTLTAGESKDRGIEYRYFDTSSGSMKLGWFGYKTSTRKFTFMVDAVNTDELITGTLGNLEMGALSTTQLEISEGGNLNLNCGNLLGVNTINGCGGVINISAGTRVSFMTNQVSLPNNVPLSFGTSGSNILENTVGSIVVSGSRNINLSASSTIIPVNSYISFSGNSVGLQRISGNTSGELLINASSNIYLTPTGGNVIVPSNTNVQLGGTSQVIYGNTGGIVLLSSNSGSSLNMVSNGKINLNSSFGNVELNADSGDIYLYTSVGSTRLLENRFLVFSNNGTSNSILGSSGNLVINGSGGSSSINLRNTKDINLLASSAVNIPVDVYLTFSDGSRYIVADTSGNLIMNGQTTVITNTSGKLLVNNMETYITSSNFNVSGNVINLDSGNVRVRDPIITLANYNILADDNKDRGVEYKYFDVSSGSMKLGWFGWKDSTSRFTYYSDAINTGEVITGTLGQMEMGGLVISNNLSFTNAGVIDMNCGTIANARTVIGCSGVLNVIGTDSVNMTSSNIMLNAGTKVQLPYNVPVVFGTTTSSISGDTNGNMRIVASNNLIIDANVQINGTTMNVYSTVTNIQDPIVSLGGVSGPIINDNKDRGVEFKWGNNAVTKTGFFGYKNNLGRFVYIQDGINNNEVFSGSYGSVQFGDGYFSNLDLAGGTISNVKTIIGNDINISSGNITIPFNSRIAFGSTSNSISGDTGGNISISSASGGISLLTNTGGSGYININSNTSLNVGGSTIIEGTNGNLQIINTSGNIELNPDENVIIPENKYLDFGSRDNSITSDGDNLILNGYNGINMNSSSVTISGSVNITGTLSVSSTDFDIDEYILPLGRYQEMLITAIDSYTSTSGNVRITTNGANYLAVGDKVILTNTDSSPEINGEYTVVEIIDGSKFLINKVGGISISGSSGNLKSNLKVDPGKDVGIGVNYWKDLVGNNVVTGSVNYHMGFFGWKNTLNRWMFYNDAVITDDVVVSGTLGNMQVNKVFTNNMSGFVLDGGISAGSNRVSGSDFRINGGTIDTTPIGATMPQTGRFTSLSNTVSALFRDVTMETSMKFNIDRYNIVSSLPTPTPSVDRVMTVFTVLGVNYTSSMAEMQSNPSLVADGTYKVLVCGSMGVGCQHTIYFGEGKLICPNPLTGPVPTRLVFKRTGQSCSLVYDQVLAGWILLNSGAYVF